MITKRVIASDGVARTLEGKIFGGQLRVYKILGDVTNREALEETAQILAIELGLQEVVFTL